MKAQVVLTPAEGKRLIAKAISCMEPVQKAYQEGILIVATSTSTAYVAEELMQKEIPDKGMFTAGVVTATGLNITKAEGRHSHHVFEKGKLKECNTAELVPYLSRMGPSDVFIKGANAIDSFGAAGILLAGAGGGTIGTAWGYIVSNGIQLIIPAGLEKLVPGPLDTLQSMMGTGVIDAAMGWKCGMIVVHGQVITEMEAMKLLFDVDAVPIAAGGIDGAEGCKVFLVEGPKDNVELAMEVLGKVKGEAPLKTQVTGWPKK
ncbi:hypothetical protein A3K69_06455 [Candidatus Bathyarchaeota archaeon RBG_16_57_9]|jgi:hypothetical protein|nr:MAG: hypothetical protein A3K69_06455 [Candidatus Bathyarchaeota archaeon RBG_16_57_9]OGD54435.1 MAG: hypothetical protein A3K81_06140 [Candidatus Bathyarchaeota archaeon RBG_13_60_20]